MSKKTDIITKPKDDKLSQHSSETGNTGVKTVIMLRYFVIAIFLMVAIYLIVTNATVYTHDQIINTIYSKEKTFFSDYPGAVCEFKGNYIGGNKSIDVYYCDNKLSSIAKNNERLVVYVAKNGSIVSDRLESEDKTMYVMLSQVASK